VFYRDIHDNKPPLLYITAGLAGSLQNFRVILLFWNLVNLWLIWLIAKKIFQNQFWPVVVSSVMFAILSSGTFLEGNIANGEVFMIMPMTAAALLLLKERYFPAGVLLAVGFLFKVPVVLDWLAMMLFLLWQQRQVWRRWGLMLAGFLGPNVLVAGYYWYMGAGERYLKAALLQNMPYLTSWGGGAPAGGWWQSGLFQRGLVVLILTGGIFVWRKKFNRWQAWLSLWLLFGLYGALLSERPYPHYFMEVVPALSLLLGLAMMKGWFNKAMLLAAAGLILFSYQYYSFWRYPVVGYYKNFWQWAVGKKDVVSYQRYWGEQVLVDQRAAEYVSRVTEPEDRIYVWGTAPGIYYLSERLPVGRYTVAYHVADFDGYEETMKFMAEEPPPVVVWLKSEKLAFPALERFIEEGYRLDKTVGDREIYLRLME
jgi:hypothetical protein